MDFLHSFSIARIFWLAGHFLWSQTITIQEDTPMNTYAGTSILQKIIPLHFLGSYGASIHHSG